MLSWLPDNRPVAAGEISFSTAGLSAALNLEHSRFVQSLELQVIRSANGLSALAEEWNDLAARCPGYFLSQTFQWAETAWETIARTQPSELNCLALRSAGRLVAVWPLTISRDGAVRTIRPLCFEVREYCAPLVEPGDEAESLVAFLWQAVARSADLAIFPRLRADSPLSSVLKDAGRWRVTDGASPAPYVARADYPDWAAFHRSISSNLRYEIRRMRRRLAEQGEVVLARESTAGAATLIDWMLDHKTRWLAHSNLTNDWIDRADCRDFLVALASREDATGGVALFALKLNGAPIAGWLVSVDRNRVEGYFTVYDLEWNFYSPGHMITEYLLQWAFERGLDFDFRIGDQSYKYKWAKRSSDTHTWHVAITNRGIPTVARLRAALLASQTRQALALGRFVPPKWRDRLKALLARRAGLSKPT